MVLIVSPDVLTIAASDVARVGSSLRTANLLAALPTTLTGHSCVIIRDGATYTEQVTVQNFVNNGASITIRADHQDALIG